MRQPFRLLVTGSRTWRDVRTIEQALAVILDRHPEGVLLVHGACPRGADAIAAAYAARTPGYQVEAHPADWRRTGRAAGYRRNAEMIAPGRGRVRRVHPRRQPRQHQRRPAGQSSRHPGLAPHPALIDRAELTATVTATTATSG
jgi:YspA, cpYpsA-related SLOG family